MDSGSVGTVVVLHGVDVGHSQSSRNLLLMSRLASLMAASLRALSMWAAVVVFNCFDGGLQEVAVVAGGEMAPSLGGAEDNSVFLGSEVAIGGVEPID